MEKSVQQICIIGTMIMAGNMRRPCRGRGGEEARQEGRREGDGRLVGGGHREEHG